MFGKKKKLKYKIVFLRQEYQTMNVVKIREVKALNAIIKEGTKAFVITYKFPTYNNGLDKFYFIDIETGKQLTFDAITRELNPEELDLIVGNKIIRELTSGVMDNKKEKIFFLAIGFIIGALLAAIIVMSLMQGKVDKILSDTTIIPIPFLPGG